MAAIATLLSLALMVAVLAATVKLAALVYRGTKVRWRHAFVFCAIAFAVGFAMAALAYATARVLPNAVPALLGIALFLCVGGRYLGPRAQTRAGVPIGFKDGVLVSLVILGVVLALGALAPFLLPAIRSVAEP